MIRIDDAICTKCNTCSRYCMAGIIAEGPEIKKDVHRYCISCGHCVVACPSGAISVVSFEDLEIPPFAKALPVSSQAMESLLRRRRSIRHYKAEPVSREHLEKIIEASSLVPTGGNARSFKAYVCTDREVMAQIHRKVTEYFARYLEVLKHPVEGIPDEMRARLARAIDHLMLNPPEGKDFLFWNAPAFVVFTTTTPNPIGIGDAWIASFAGVMYAETIPVGTCYNGLMIEAMNGDPSIKPLLKIPTGELTVSGFTMGYSEEEHFRYPPRRPMPTTWI